MKGLLHKTVSNLKFFILLADINVQLDKQNFIELIENLTQKYSVSLMESQDKRILLFQAEMFIKPNNNE